MYCWFINIELKANNTITHAWRELILTRSFLYKAHSRLPALTNTQQQLSAMLGAILNSKEPTENKNAEKHGTKLIVKRTLVYSMWVETRKQNITCLTSAEKGTLCGLQCM